MLFAVVTLIGLSIRYTILSPSFIKTQLQEANFYEVIAEDLFPELLKTAISQQGEDDLGTPTESESSFEYTDEELQQIATETVSAEWLQTNVEASLDELEAFLNFEKDEPEIAIDLTDIRENLLSNVTGLFEDKYNDLPICTEAQEREMEQGGSKGEMECRPEGITFEELQEEFGEDFDFKAQTQEGFEENFPSELNPLDPNSWSSTEDGETKDQDQDIKSGLLQFRDKYKLGTTLLYIGAAVSTLLCVVALLINLKNLRSGFKWAGIPLIVAGAFVFISALSMGALASRLVTAQITTESLEMTGALITQITSLIGRIVKGIMGKARILSLIPLLTGILLVGLSFIFKKKGKEQPAAAQTQNPPQSIPQAVK